MQNQERGIGMQTTKRFKFTFAIVSVGYILLGLMLLLAPNMSPQVICYVLGGACGVLGLFLIAFYFIKDDQGQPMRNDLALGVVLIAFGVYLFTLLQPETLIGMLSIFMGFAVLYDSIIKLTSSFDIKKNGFGFWWILTILAIVTAVLGILLVINPFDADFATYFFGGVLVADGIINIIVLIFTMVFNGNPKHLKDKRTKIKLPKEKKENKEEPKPEAPLPGELPVLSEQAPPAGEAPAAETFELTEEDKP